MAAVCAAAPLALANQLPRMRLYSALVRSSRKLPYIRNPTFTFASYRQFVPVPPASKTVGICPHFLNKKLRYQRGTELRAIS